MRLFATLDMNLISDGGTNCPSARVYSSICPLSIQSIRMALSFLGKEVLRVADA